MKTTTRGVLVLVVALTVCLLASGDRALATTLITPSTDAGWVFDPASGRWEKDYDDFRRDDLDDEQRRLGDRPTGPGGRTELERGCVGVTNVLAGFPSEDFTISDCYRTEAEALAAAKALGCPDGQEPKIFAIRYWDTKKDTRTVGPDGKYPVDTAELYRARPGYVNFDFGFRQSDGSYVHANHQTPGMKVKISPSKDQFDNGYAGFNTVLYCVRCGPGGDDGGDQGQGDGQDQGDGQGQSDDQEGQAPPGQDQAPSADILRVPSEENASS